MQESDRYFPAVLAVLVAFVAVLTLLNGCGTACVYDLRKVATTPVPMYGVIERCEREVCRSPLRLPSSATITGACQ
jgi:hypothetical protein